jgi:cation diffusion facilitator family transporter
VLVATRFSSNAPDEGHPYGHHRFENGASLVLGVLLMLVGGVLIWAAATGLWIYFSQHTLASSISWIAAAIAAFVLISKELLFHYLMRVAKRLKSRLLEANAWHARADALSSLVVLVGLIGFALGYAWLDRLAALVVGVMIVKTGSSFAWSALCDLMDQSVPAHDLDTLRTLAARVDGVLGIHDLKARRAGDGMLVDIHIDVQGDQTVRQGHDIAHAVRDALLKHEHVIDVLVHVDPA